MKEILVGVVHEFMLQSEGFSGVFDAFMNVGSAESHVVSTEEPDNESGIPSAVLDPLSEEVGAPGNLVTIIVAPHRGGNALDLCSQSRRHTFIGVQPKYPVARPSLDRARFCHTLPIPFPTHTISHVLP